jgi:hypothetical protein
MRVGNVLRSFAAVLLFSLAVSASPASARRTVIDAGLVVNFDSYCSPLVASTDGCSATSLPFTLQLGGQTFDSFYVNSNGTLTLGSIETLLAAQNTFGTPPEPYQSLSQYDVPVFSPNFVDGQGFLVSNTPEPGFDGAFVSETTLSANSLSVVWYPCTSMIDCQLLTYEVYASASVLSLGSTDFFANTIYDTGFALLCPEVPCEPYPGDEAIFEAGQQEILDNFALTTFGLTLTNLDSGFMLQFSYGNAAGAGTYGFDLPGASFEATGPLVNRTFLFDANGQLVSEVPEPATWLMMLLGLGLVGAALRQEKRAQAVQA